MTDVYDRYISNLRNSFYRRGGVPLDCSEEELEALCEVETMLRSTPDGTSLSDKSSGFDGVFLEKFKDQVHKDYLEYKKLYLSMSMDDFLTREIPADELEGDVVSSSEEEVVTSIKPEVVEARMAVLALEDQGPVSTQTNEVVGELLTADFGVDDRGFDMWAVDESLEFGDMDLEMGSVASIPSTRNILLTEPIGTDSRDFDIWEEEIKESSIEEPSFALLTEPVDTDNRGFDVWVNSEPSEFVFEEIDDLDHSNDEQMAGLVSLITEPQGTDERGFDVWKAPIAQELLTEPYGVDSHGFDTWVAPEQPKVALSPGTVRLPRPAPQQTIPFQTMRKPIKKSSEDETVEAMQTIVNKVLGAGVRFGKFLSR